MSRELLVGLDIGGGGGRSLLLDRGSGAVTIATRKWRFQPVPRTGGLGWDLDLEAIWSHLANATREVLERANASADQVRGVAATSLRYGSAMIADGGEVVLATPNRDARAAGPGLVLAANHGQALHEQTGHWPMPIFGSARLIWLKNERPDDFARIRSVFGLSDWLTFRLTGASFAEPSQAAATGLLDIATRDWAWNWIERLELPRHIFPELRDGGSTAGTLTAAAADALGLRAGTPVGLAGGDSQCGLLGAGACAHGDVAIIAGTTAPVQLVLDRPFVDPEARLWSEPHVVPGRWVIESNAGAIGETLEWFGRILYGDAPLPVARLLAEARSSEPGASGMLSTLGGQVMNARQSGLPIGTLTLEHLSTFDDAAPRRHLVRSLVEGHACALRANLEQLDAAGVPRGDLRLAGGLSRSDTFAGILADVIGAPVGVTAVPEATPLGAALCASVAAGVFPDLASAADAVAKERKRIEPGPGAAKSAEVYAAWTRLREERSASDATAAGLAMPYVLAANDVAAAASGDAPRPRMLVTASADPAGVAALAQLGHVEYASFRDKGRMLKGDTLVEAVADFDVFITEIDVVEADVLPRLPRLRVVASCRGDAVNVDIPACSAHGIPVLNTPGRNADAVADLTLGFLLALGRKLVPATRFLHTGVTAGDMGKMGQAFVTLQGRELFGKTIGLIGLGAVGRGVARRLAPFRARVLVFDPYIDAEEGALVGAEKVPLDTLLASSDFVSLHAAVTDETRGLIGASELAAMKKGACVVNTARAALMEEPALLEALENGHLAGAALDTFAVEPPGSDDPLLQLDNVIATPHVGGNTVEVAAHQAAIVAADLGRLLRGERPLFVLNPEVLADFNLTAPRPVPTAAELAALGDAPGPAVTDLQRDEQKRSRAGP